MRVALYVGSHPGAPILTKVGAWLTRLAQKGPYGIVTHCEAVLKEMEDGQCVVGSSVATEGGVRIATKRLDPAEWLLVDVPQWNAERAALWFKAHEGDGYDWRGAWATMLPGHAEGGRRFCSAAVLASVGWRTPDNFTPAHLAAIAYSLAAEAA